MAIPDYRLPEGIEKGASGGPDFKTLIQESAAGHEQRIIGWAQCRARYDIGYGILHSDDSLGNYSAVLALFYGHVAKAYPFRFKAWNDYQIGSERIGTGDGVTTQFQLSKTYDPSKLLLGFNGPHHYLRNIVLPVASSLVINLRNTITLVSTPTTAYTLAAGELITLASAPSATTEVWCSGEFDLPMRFDVDHLPVIMNEADLVHIGSIQLREVIGEF